MEADEVDVDEFPEIPNYDTLVDVMQLASLSPSPAPELQLWKMNLMQTFEDLLFLVEGFQILIYRLNEENDFKKFHQRLEVPNQQTQINQIKVGNLGGKAALAVVDDSGKAFVYFLDKFDEKPFSVSVAEVGAWGISFHPKLPVIAVSSNSHKIVLVNVIDGSKIVLPGHDHNIPCIDFSPCGNYLSSVGIDQKLKIWDLSTMKSTKETDICEWGWSCKWIQKSHVYEETELNSTDWDFRRNLTYFDISEKTRNLMLEEIQAEENSEGDDEEEENEGEESLRSEDEALPEATKTPEPSSTNESKMEEAHAPIEEKEPPTKEQKLEVEAAISTSTSCPEDFVLVTTAHHVGLFDPKQQKFIASFRDAIDTSLLPLPAVFRHLERLNIVEFIPELSLLVLVSQGSCMAELVHIVKKEISGEFSYQFLPVTVLPSTLTTLSPVMGMSVTRHRSPTGQMVFRLYVYHYKRNLFVYEIRQKASKLDVEQIIL